MGGLTEAGNTVVIESVLNGYIVQVGCKRVVFEDKEKMLSEVSRYFDNPEAVAKEYMSKIPLQL